MKTSRVIGWSLLLTALLSRLLSAAEFSEQDPAYYHEGELRGSLRSAAPLPLYDADLAKNWPKGLEIAVSYVTIVHIPETEAGFRCALALDLSLCEFCASA